MQIPYLFFCTYQAVDPSHDLKQRTLAGVSRVKKQLNQSKRSKQFSRPPSHLQRGYGNPGGILRPLGRPVTTSGPLMRNCQGIVAGKCFHFKAKLQQQLFFLMSPEVQSIAIKRLKHWVVLSG